MSTLLTLATAFVLSIAAIIITITPELLLDTLTIEAVEERPVAAASYFIPVVTAVLNIVTNPHARDAFVCG